MTISQGRRLTRVTRRIGTAAALVLGVSLAGCGGSTVKPEAADPTVIKSNSDAYAQWATVLRKHVNIRGDIDFVDLFRDRQELDNFAAWIAENSPANNEELARSVNSKVAFHINAFNALAMHSVLEAQLPRDFNGFYERYRFFSRRGITVGGSTTNLRDYENNVIRKFNEERVHFALNRMVKGSPRLPRTPYTAARIGSELEAATKLFINDPKNVYIDIEKQTVWVSELFDFYKSDFLRRAPSIASYINLYRNDPLPEGYKIRYIDFDWRLNHARN